MEVIMAEYLSKAIWDCALECALRRKKRICKCKDFGGVYCQSINCKYDIRNYTDRNERELKLMMLQADGEACAIKLRGERHHFGFAMAIAGIIFFIYLFWTDKNNLPVVPNVPQVTKQQTVTPPSQSKVQQKNVVPGDQFANINKTLKIVTDSMSKRIDVNGDGLINCIDAAVLFYQYYPDKSKVCIELNVNSTTGMNHLFNCVFTDGVWRAIEPQAHWKNHSSYWMRDVWGNKYDNSYNRDVTQDYIKFVK